MQDWQYYLYSPFTLILFVLPVIIVIGLLVAVFSSAGSSVQPPGRLDVRGFLALAPAHNDIVEVTGRFMVGKDNQAWLESTDSPAGVEPPRLRIFDPKSVEAILRLLPAREGGNSMVDTFAWFRGKKASFGGEHVLASITEGSVLYDGNDFEFKLMR